MVDDLITVVFYSFPGSFAVVAIRVMFDFVSWSIDTNFAPSLRITSIIG